MPLSKGLLSVTTQMKFTLLPETLKVLKCYINCTHDDR